MAVTVEWRNDKGVVLSCSGVLTGQELIDANRSMVAEGNRGLRYAILDISAVEKIQVSPADVRATVEDDRRLAAMAAPGMLVAIAAPQDLGFGLARMWEVFAGRETEWRISVFRSMDDANSWIKQNLDRPERH
jgi:hypothetical protein